MPHIRKGESLKKFVHRCVPVRQKEHPDEEVKQSVVVCYSMGREQRKKGEK